MKLILRISFQVPLRAEYSLKISRGNLTLAVSYGKIESEEGNLKKMINKLMESVYTREYMANHSYTGRRGSKKDGDKSKSAKEPLP